MKKLKFLLAIGILSLLVACGASGMGQLPEDKQDYAGTWQNEYINLTISTDAKIDYQYNKDNVSKSLNAPIVQFKGNNFEAGALGIKTEFIVNQAPIEEEGVWVMTIDGHKLTKAN